MSNKVVESFLRRPRRHQIAFACLPVFVILLLGWQYLVSPNFERLTKIKEDIQRKESQITNEQRTARNLKKYREQVKDLDLKLSALLRELPNKGEVDTLLGTVSQLARDSGLEVPAFQPQDESLRDFYAERPVSITIRGTFHRIVTFFDEVARLERIVNLQNIVLWNQPFKESKTILLNSADTSEFDLRATLTATVFRYLDESERTKIQAEREAKATQGSRRKR